jgi:hypothetical protein
MSESEMQIMSNKAVVDGHQIGYAGELVTIATFPEPAEASVARAALESAGINVFLLGESANMMIPVAFTAQLQVRAEDEVAARSILEAMNDSPETMESVTAAEMADEVSRSGAKS